MWYYLKVSKQLKYSLILLLTSIIWGFAFAFQSLGGDKVGPITFYCVRNYIATITLALFLIFIRKDDDLSDNAYSIKMGIICGVIEFVASLIQQIAIGHTSAANCSFITAMYVILVPIFGYILGEKTDKKLWFCVVLELVGLYLLCLGDGFSINKGDLYTFISAILFAIHIIIIAKGGKKIDAILFTFVQFVVGSILATILMFIFERPIDLEGIKQATIPLLYTGVLSSGVAITLQVTCQRNVDPTVASLIMCLESVFGAIGGYLILHEVLSFKEILGCTIMFIAIFLSQLPSKKKE